MQTQSTIEESQASRRGSSATGARWAIVAAGACLLLASVACMFLLSFIHYSLAAEFDASKPINLTGTVTKIEWTDPHAYVYLNVSDEQTRNVTNWMVVMGNPKGLIRRGWSRNSMKIGDQVTVEGSRAKDDTNAGNARSVTLASGQRLFAATSQQEVNP
jgi:hypothetical protein